MAGDKFSGFLDAAYRRMPGITRRVGWAGLMLGPALGFAHTLAIIFRPAGYGRRVMAQYDEVLRTGDLWSLPLAQMLIWLGFLLCLLWGGLWGMRLVLAARQFLRNRRGRV